jgi:hypothetical protein
VDITVTTFSGTSATGAGDKFTYSAAPAPSIAGVTASSGLTSGGTVVTITGSNFTGASAVKFGTTATSSFSVLPDNAIVATAPTGAAGTVDISVVTPSGTSSSVSADHFTYTAVPTPTITSLNPSTGGTGGGTAVTITGTNFTNATGVSFGSISAASFFVVSDTSIIASAPPQAAGTYDITVTAYDKVSAFTGADRYSYSISLAPSVTGISPSTGSTAGGTLVAITGNAFTGVTRVSFGSAVASFTVNSDTSITATAPSQGAGTFDVIVATPMGTSPTAAADQFTYTVATTPAVTSLSLSSGSTAGGTVVTITGTNFTGATAVSFGTVAASFVVNSDTRITATAPPQAAGTIDVKVTTPSGTSSAGAGDHFTYGAATAPSVAGVTPSSGTTAGGTLVSIYGSNFTGASAVTFGSTAATSFTVLSDSAITAYAPAGTAGIAHTTVTTPSGTSTTSGADQFTYVADSVPTITGLNTTSGSSAGGAVVVITGTNFSTTKGVNFGSYSAAWFTVNSATQITAVAPSQAAGIVDITVTANGGTSATGAADQFTYSAAPAPTVTAIGLNIGSVNGASSVTITGTGFTGATAVNFGSTAATSFIVVSDTTIFASTPAEIAATIDVTVKTPSGTSTISANDNYTFASSGSLSSGSQTPITALQNMSYSGSVASFSGGGMMSDPTQFTVVINWGDGYVTVGGAVSAGGGSYMALGGHTYSSSGTFNLTIMVTQKYGASIVISNTANVGSGHAPTRPGPVATGTQATATHGTPFQGFLASFLDSGSTGPAGSFKVSINWGDGVTSNGTVTPNGKGGFDVGGAHTFASAGAFTVMITITDANGVSTTVADTITVVDARQADTDEEVNDQILLDFADALVVSPEAVGIFPAMRGDDASLSNLYVISVVEVSESSTVRRQQTYDDSSDEESAVTTIESALVEERNAKADGTATRDKGLFGTRFSTLVGNTFASQEDSSGFWSSYAGNDKDGDSLSDALLPRALEELFLTPLAVLDDLFIAVADAVAP